jgi:RNA polymerase-binding transcription factor DksA
MVVKKPKPSSATSRGGQRTPATAGGGTKEAAPRKAAKKRAAGKRAPAKKAAVKKAAEKKAAAKAPAKKAAVREPAAREPAAAGKPPAERPAGAKKTAAKKTAARKAPARKTTAKKTTAKKATASKAPARKAAGKKAAADRAASHRPAREAPANKTGVRKVAAKKTVAEPAATSGSPVPAARAGAGPDALAVLPGEDPWSPEEIEQARAQLLGEVERLKAEIASSEAAVAGLLRDSGDGAGDEADTGSNNITREYEMALAANTRETLTQATRALRRLDEGTYGLCEVCGNPIGKARMQAFPRATLCLDDKQKQERR